MKKIEAVIKPFKLDEVKEALHEVGVQGITVSEVRASAGRRANRGLPRRRVLVDFLPKVKIEVVCEDAWSSRGRGDHPRRPDRTDRRRQDLRLPMEE